MANASSISTKPFIASHSSVYKLSQHFRNFKDDQILEIKKVGGLVGLNPYPFFIDTSFRKKEEVLIKEFYDELNQINIKETNETVFNFKKGFIVLLFRRTTAATAQQ